MSLYNLGLPYLTANSPKYVIPDPDIGIVTATDTNTFIGVKTLYLSVKNKINFVCYDIGMSEEDLEWCKNNNLTIAKFNINIPLIDKWQTYLKPFIIKDSPYEYTLWIDSDCIVTGDLSTSDIIQNKQTFFTRHWMNNKYLRKNRKELYEIHPVEGESEPINAGVFGINKTTDASILEQWIFLVNETLRHNTIRSHVVNWDEGSLFWAIQKTNKGKLVVDDCSKYNFFTEFRGDNLYTDSDLEKLYDRPTEQLPPCISPTIFFKQILKGNAVIRHFSTCMKNGKKYWRRWD